MPIKKVKRRGFDLVKKDVLPTKNIPNNQQNRHSNKTELARIQTRRMMYTSDGTMVSLTPEKTTIWLAQMDPVNQIVLQGRLDEEGYSVNSFPMLVDIPKKLKENTNPPKLMMVDARAVGQQVPFFRKMIIPILKEKGVSCLISGLTQMQEKIYRQWYEGEVILSGDLEHVIRHIRKMIGPGLR